MTLLKKQVFPRLERPITPPLYAARAAIFSGQTPYNSEEREECTEEGADEREDACKGVEYGCSVGVS